MKYHNIDYFLQGYQRSVILLTTKYCVKLQDQPVTNLEMQKKNNVMSQISLTLVPPGQDLDGTNLLMLQAQKWQLLHLHLIDVMLIELVIWLMSTQQKLAKPNGLNSALVGKVLLAERAHGEK